MKRRSRVFALLLTCSLLCTLLPAARAGAAAPMPPSWCRLEEYVVFEGSAAYAPENWEKILLLRADAEAGGATPKKDGDAQTFKALSELRSALGKDSGMWFEYGLIMQMYLSNEGNTRNDSAWDSFDRVLGALPQDSPGYPAVYLWRTRAGIFWGNYEFEKSLDTCLVMHGMTLEQFMDCKVLAGATPQQREELAAALARERSIIYVVLDGVRIHPAKINGEETGVQSRNQRTMVPVRFLAEALGAEVDWDGAASRITLKRAGDTILMTLDSTDAYRNGEAIEMDVAPYAEAGRTYIPARYISEFFGQTVQWDAGQHTVFITENKAGAGQSNLEAWALPMGAMLNYKKNNSWHVPTVFGGMPRRQGVSSVAVNVLSGKSSRDEGRARLTGSWGITGRADLIDTVLRMTEHGHNDSFLEAAAIADGLTEAQMKALIAQSSATDQYMWPYTKALSQKWGDRGIIAWDLFRMSNLVQWGYLAGYVTYPEALALLERAAGLLRENFSSWDEAYENYLDGYNWWARNNVGEQNVWETERGKYYLEMKGDPELSPIFDDALFKNDIIPVPGVTAEALAKEIS